jgi:endonuclease/exonuclease/phosphatase family metal-dependent hydrolase
MQSLRVLTLNLWCESGPFEKRISTAVQLLSELEPDLVALQEVVDRGRDSGARYLAEALGLSYSFGVVDPVSGVGNALLSRYPVIEHAAVALPSEPGDPRAALAALVATPRGRLPFVSTHLSWEPEFVERRGRQALALEALAGSLPGDLPALIAGDLNEVPEGAAIAFLTGRGALSGRRGLFRDIYAEHAPGAAGHTWSSRNPFTGGHGGDRRLDYLLLAPPRKGFGRIRQAGIALDRAGANGVFASDHFAVLADIEALSPA